MYDIDSAKVEVEIRPLGESRSGPHPARYMIEPGDGTRYSILVFPMDSGFLGPAYLQSWGTLIGKGFVIIELLHGVAMWIPAGDYLSFFCIEDALKLKNPCTVYWLTFLISRAIGCDSEIEKFPNSKDWLEQESKLQEG